MVKRILHLYLNEIKLQKNNLIMILEKIFSRKEDYLDKYLPD